MGSDQLNFMDRQFDSCQKVQGLDKSNSNLIGSSNQNSCPQTIKNSTCTQGYSGGNNPLPYSNLDSQFSTL